MDAPLSLDERADGDLNEGVADAFWFRTLVARGLRERIRKASRAGRQIASLMGSDTAGDAGAALLEEMTVFKSVGSALDTSRSGPAELPPSVTVTLDEIVEMLSEISLGAGASVDVRLGAGIDGGQRRSAATAELGAHLTPWVLALATGLSTDALEVRAAASHDRFAIARRDTSKQAVFEGGEGFLATPVVTKSAGASRGDTIKQLVAVETISTVRMMLGDLADELGLSIEFVRTIDQLDKTIETKGPFRALIVDPQQVNGDCRALIERMRGLAGEEGRSALPVIAMTPAVPTATMKGYLASGFAAVLEKPPSRASLAEALERCDERP